MSSTNSIIDPNNQTNSSEVLLNQHISTYDQVKEYFDAYIKTYPPYKDFSVFKAFMYVLKNTFANNIYSITPDYFIRLYENHEIPEEIVELLLQQSGYSKKLLASLLTETKIMLIKNLADFEKYKGTIKFFKKLCENVKDKTSIYELFLNYIAEGLPYYKYTISSFNYDSITNNSYLKIFIEDVGQKYVEIFFDKDATKNKSTITSGSSSGDTLYIIFIYKYTKYDASTLFEDIRKELNNYFKNVTLDLTNKTATFNLEQKKSGVLSEKPICTVTNVTITSSIKYEGSPGWFLIPRPVYEYTESDDDTSEDISSITYQRVYNKIPSLLMSEGYLNELKKNSQLVLPIKTNLLLLNFSKIQDISLLNNLIASVIINKLQNKNINNVVIDDSYTVTLSLKNTLILLYYLLTKYYKVPLRVKPANKYQLFPLGESSSGSTISIDFSELATIESKFNEIDSAELLTEFYNKYISPNFNVDYSPTKQITEILLLRTLSSIDVNLVDKLSSIFEKSTDIDTTIIDMTNNIRNSIENYLSTYDDDSTDESVSVVSSYASRIMNIIPSIASDVTNTDTYRLLYNLKPYHAELITDSSAYMRVRQPNENIYISDGDIRMDVTEKNNVDLTHTADRFGCSINEVNISNNTIKYIPTSSSYKNSVVENPYIYYKNPFDYRRILPKINISYYVEEPSSGTKSPSNPATIKTFNNVNLTVNNENILAIYNPEMASGTTTSGVTITYTKDTSTGKVTSIFTFNGTAKAESTTLKLFTSESDLFTLPPGTYTFGGLNTRSIHGIRCRLVYYKLSDSLSTTSNPTILCEIGYNIDEKVSFTVTETIYKCGICIQYSNTYTDPLTKETVKTNDSFTPFLSVGQILALATNPVTTSKTEVSGIKITYTKDTSTGKVIDGINFTGTATNNSVIFKLFTSVDDLYTLYPGTYVFSGLDKKSIYGLKCQLVYYSNASNVTNGNNPTVLCEIGYETQETASFTITKTIKLCGIIVQCSNSYQDPSTGSTVYTNDTFTPFLGFHKLKAGTSQAWYNNIRTNYNIALPSECCGGYIDYKSKKLVTTHTKVRLKDLTWSTWTETDSETNEIIRMCFYSKNFPDTIDTSKTFTCTHYLESKATVAHINLEDLHCKIYPYQETDSCIMIRNDTYTTLAAFKASLTGNEYVYCALKEPIETSLSNLPEIWPLENNNPYLTTTGDNENIITIDLQSLTWSTSDVKSSTGTVLFTIFYAQLNNDYVDLYSRYTIDTYQSNSIRSSTNLKNKMGYIYFYNTIRIGIRDDSYTTIADFKASLTNKKLYCQPIRTKEPTILISDTNDKIQIIKNDNLIQPS